MIRFVIVQALSVTFFLWLGPICGALTLEEFQGIIFTEVHDEVHAVLSTGSNRRTQDIAGFTNLNSDVQDLWSHIIDHGWSNIETSAQKSGFHDNAYGRSLRGSPRTSDDFVYHPLLLCNASPRYKTGAQRRRMIQNDFGHILQQDMMVVYNDKEKTCFHVSAIGMEATKLRNISSSEFGQDYAVVPMTDIMKITVNSFEEILNGNWSLPLASDSVVGEWERMIRVAFTTSCPHAANEDEVIDTARSVLSYAQSLGKQGAMNRRLADSTIHGSSSSTKGSLTESFSLTSAFKNVKSRKLAEALSKGRVEMFDRSVKHGLEADHGCKSMFDEMEIRPQDDMKGFDIVLNPILAKDVTQVVPSNGDDITAMSSARNVDCIISLVMALSTHPSVLNVEVDSPPSFDDYDAKWITQSKQPGYTPLSDAGITGKGQIISMIDSGVQPDHRLFGPVSASVIDNWDTSQRKIVSYNTQYGDDHDVAGGHGTAVASVMVGKALSGNTNANGIAEDAKLHVMDVSNGGMGIYIPGSPRQIFQIMYNNGNGAKIANGSFSTTYSVYRTSCRMYDNELFGDYQELVYVASAGNEGLDGNKSRMNTIGNPAACKNTIAVGASQSSGDKVHNGDLGMNYLAMFSSRGPTADDRMKPDIVAPGYTLEAARAYGGNGQDTFLMMGTSFAAPVVAGNAALVRQYFEEGWFPCGIKGCGEPIKPSGSLVKAVLLNGGQNLERVQKVLATRPEDKVIGEDLAPYDNSQGMGLVNLRATLPMNDGTNFNGLIENNREIMDGQEHTFWVRARTAIKRCRLPELSVTLAWYDEGAANGCAKCLLNDLDVTVQQTMWTGTPKGPVYRSNNKIDGDDRNNVERVRIYMRKNGRYRITVKASNLSQDSIKYSLISTGCFRVLQVNV